MKALLVRIEGNTFSSNGLLPDSFTISDGTLASLVNCASDLDVDELVDAGFIKRFLQRLRAAEAS